MAVKVISPGLSTSVQDLGRPGHYHVGIPEGGGMDRFATRIANLLVGNDPGAAVLEATFMGLNSNSPNPQSSPSREESSHPNLMARNGRPGKVFR